ncbi:MAG: chorismate mutase [Leucobacter sp.]
MPEPVHLLSDVRNEIDGLDRQIIGLIAERQKWVVEAGKLKEDESAVRAPDRVERVIGRVRDLAVEAGASPDVVERAYRALIAGFIEFELDLHRSMSDSTVTTRRAAVEDVSAIARVHGLDSTSPVRAPS